jgi:hypothetical protein
MLHIVAALCGHRGESLVRRQELLPMLAAIRSWLVGGQSGRHDTEREGTVNPPSDFQRPHVRRRKGFGQ